MDENLPQNQQQAADEQLLEQQARQQNHESNRLGAVPILLQGLWQSFFGLREGLEYDRRYRKIVNEKYEAWARNNPGKFSGKTFVRNKNGEFIINPVLAMQMPGLEESSKTEFATKHPKRSEQYKRIEKKRVYLNHNDDPAIKKLKNNISQKTATGFWQSRYPTQQVRERKERVETEEHRAFVREHPEKARYYAQKDPKIKAAFEEYKQEEWAKKSRGQRVLTRLNDSTFVPEAERKSWMPKRMRKASDLYDKKKDDAKQWLVQSKAGRLAGWNKLQQSRLSQGYQNKKNAAIQRFSQTRVGRVFSPITSYRNYFTNKKEEIKQQAIGSVKQKLVPKSIQQFSPTQQLKRLLGKAISAIAKRLPGLAGLIGRGLLGIKRFGGAMLRQGLRGITRAAGALLKSAARAAIQVAARLAAGLLVSTAPVWLPAVLIAGGVLLFIVIIAALLMTIFGGDTPQTSAEGPTATASCNVEEQPEGTTCIVLPFCSNNVKVPFVDPDKEELGYVCQCRPSEEGWSWSETEKRCHLENTPDEIIQACPVDTNKTPGKDDSLLSTCHCAVDEQDIQAWNECDTDGIDN